MALYSPKVRERFIPVLFHLARERRQPMTALVEEALEEYFARRSIPVPPRQAAGSRGQPRTGPTRPVA